MGVDVFGGVVGADAHRQLHGAFGNFGVFGFLQYRQIGVQCQLRLSARGSDFRAEQGENVLGVFQNGAAAQVVGGAFAFAGGRVFD
uniref:Uncharacterized protein n=1 Tax=Conchiformibius kuhniae TaxID=211502 RepID=A0A8T9MWS3_9NEIS|nr:hypothetical protein LVJ77_00420 [Conchiformibius kuhniae]